MVGTTTYSIVPPEVSDQRPCSVVRYVNHFYPSLLLQQERCEMVSATHAS